ncbi:MAG: dipeptidase [Gemmatimonadales bacterium]|nr:hypothetical protein HRbin33_01570 [bacterium HR33]GIW53187.1 MAG: dipeptidase [Gemmatimonadales bacterium]
MLSRREFIRSAAAAGAALPLAPWLAGRKIQQRPDIDALYDRAIVIDSLAVAYRWDDEEWAAVQKSGYTAIQTTLSSASLQASLSDLAEWNLRFAREGHRYLKVTRAEHIEQAKKERKLGVILGFQNTAQIGTDLGNLDILYALGTRCMQLTYNSRNLIGDGCTERTNAGLSDFGVAVVERMNQLGILVDLSHCGLATSADGIAVSRKPPAFTHTMCRALYDHPRAKPDELIKAMSDKGGVTGIAALGYFLGPNVGTETTFETYLDHIDHAVKVGGIDHVGLATDFQIRGISPWATRENWYEPRLRSFKPSYKVQWPPWIPELDRPERFRTVAHGLARRGYRTDAIEKLLGLNWLRLFREVLG